MNTKNKHYTDLDLEAEYGPLTFGKSLWAYRKCEEISQKDFAKMLGISISSLCDLEKERKIPSAERAARIAKLLQEPVIFWVQLALQDQIRKQGLDLKVSVA